MATVAAKKIVNEKTTARIPVSTFNIDGTPATPTTLHYTIHDVGTGQEVKAETAVVTPSTVTNIDLIPGDNAIINPLLQLEAKKMTVIADKDLATEARDQVVYYVRNLSFSS